MKKQPLPLTGIRVVDYSHYLAGPYMSRALASMGAEVIKVERPKLGDAGRRHPYFVGDHSGYFLQQNMGKKGLCLDLRQEEGRELMQRLIKTADVFVENYRPGALKKFGLGYEDLAKVNPRLVYCSVSAYGQTGPDAERAGFGLIAEAKSGAMAMVGTPGEAPPLFRMPLADMYTGAHGIAAICAALFGRERSGEGQQLDLALYDCMVSMHDFAVQAYSLSDGKVMPVRAGSDQPDSTVYGAFAAPDGYLVIAAQVDEIWVKLAALIGGAGLAADIRFQSAAGRNSHREEVTGLVRAWTMAQPSVAACMAALDAAGVPAAPVQTIDQVMDDPQIAARGMILEQNHPELGKVRLPNLPFNFSACDKSTPAIAPELGQHNAEIAAGLGFSKDEITAMEESGALYAAERPVARA